MYSAVRGIGLVRLIARDGQILSSTNRRLLGGIKNASGLQKKEAQECREVPNDLCFVKFLESRQEEASKSMVIKVGSAMDFENVYSFCSSYGVIVKMYHYQINLVNFVLVEMSQREELYNILNHSRRKMQIFDQSSKFFQTEFGIFNKMCEFKHIEMDLGKICLNTPTKPKSFKKILSDMRQESTLSDQINELYNVMKVNDLGMRLRFLTCKQLQTVISGLLPNSMVFPFGSSVTGFGLNGCDLDLVVMQNNTEAPITFQTQSKIERSLMQSQLEIISDIIKFFIIGCTKVQYIRYARVPIVKYKHFYSGVDCDLSLYIETGVKMSQLLFTLSALDERVKPLIFAIRIWARKVDLTSEQPGPSITNFSLTLLVIFFLQQSAPQHEKILPSLNMFPDNFFSLSDTNRKLPLHDIRISSQVNNKSLEKLLFLFFKFYSSFDFQNYGCCVKTGQIIEKIDSLPLYIRNPIETNLNVSRNVSLSSLNRLQQYAKRASEILENYFEGKVDNALVLSKLLNVNMYSKKVTTENLSEKCIDISKIFYKK